MDTETFLQYSDINTALNFLTDHGVLEDDAALTLLKAELAQKEYTLDDFLDELDGDQRTPQELFMQGNNLYLEVLHGDTPFNADEMVIAYLMDGGVAQSDAHTMLAAMITAEELELKISL